MCDSQSGEDAEKMMPAKQKIKGCLLGALGPVIASIVHPRRGAAGKGGSWGEPIVGTF
jgi:hypothetical protein